MKYTGIILLLGIFLITAGCISDNQKSPSTSTLQEGSGTPGVTPAQAVIPGQDPIIGVWRISNSLGYDDRIRFNADGIFVESFFDVKSKNTLIHSGTWSVQSPNTYGIHETATGESRTFIYDPEKRTIHSTALAHLLLTPYSGDVAEGIAVTPIIPTQTAAPTPVAASSGPALSSPISFSGVGHDMVYFETKSPGEVKFKIYYNLSEGEDLKCTDQVTRFMLAGPTIDTTLYYGNVYKLHDDIHTFKLLAPGRYSITVLGCWGWKIGIDNA